MGAAQLQQHQKELIPCQQLYNVRPETRSDATHGVNQVSDGPYYELGQIQDLSYFYPNRDEQDRLLWDNISSEAPNLFIRSSVQAAAFKRQSLRLAHQFEDKDVDETDSLNASSGHSSPSSDGHRVFPYSP